MSLIRQFWLLLTATLVLALLGSVSVNLDTSRANLQTQLRIKNSDTAAVLSLALAKQGGDEASMAQVLGTQFDVRQTANQTVVRIQPQRCNHRPARRLSRRVERRAFQAHASRDCH